MDLEAFLVRSRLQALAPALQQAGVETVEELQAYYEDIRALAPEDFRQEMAETFGCKRIEVSRLVAALDRHASGGAAGQPQRPQQAATGALQRGGSVGAAMCADAAERELADARVGQEAVVPRTVSPPAHETAIQQDSHDLCAEFDEPMTAETPWLAAAVVSAETDHPEHPPPPYDDAWLPAATEQAERVDVVVEDNVFDDVDDAAAAVDDALHDIACPSEEQAVAEGSDAALEGELMEEDGFEEVNADTPGLMPDAAGEGAVVAEEAAGAAGAALLSQSHDTVLPVTQCQEFEPSAPMFNSAGHEDEYDLQAVSEEFDAPLTCAVLPPLPLPATAPASVADAAAAAAAAAGRSEADAPVCTVTAAEYNPEEHVVVVAVRVVVGDSTDVGDVAANCVVVYGGRAVNARSHDLHRSDGQDQSEGPCISGSLTFDLGLRPLDAGAELPRLRLEYDGEEVSAELELTVAGAGETAATDDSSPELQRPSSDSIVPVGTTTEVFEMHGLERLSESSSPPAPVLASEAQSLEAAVRQALFVADEFEDTDGEDDRSSHSSAYTRPSVSSSSPVQMRSPIVAAPAGAATAAAAGAASGASTGAVAGMEGSVFSIASYADGMDSLSQLPTVEAVYVSGEGEALHDGVAVEAEVVNLDIVGQQDDAGPNVSEIVGPPPPVPASRRLDVPTMDLIARQPKSGPLKKFAKYMKGSWHERYFVLDGRALWYFKTKKDFNRNNEAKRRVLELAPHSAAVRVSTPHAFVVANSTDSWTLLAANDTDMYEWMNAINAHIHFLFIRMHGVRVGGFGELLEFPQYFTLTTKSKKAMAIRSIPDFKGPRTGGVVQPGEIIEVVQLFPAGAQPQDDEVFFRLSDDKGWVFQVVAGGEKVIAPAAGFAFDENGFYQIHSYQIHSRCRTAVPLRFGPSFHSQATGQSLQPGEKFRACRRWVSGVNEGADFLKLVASSGKEGWVQVFNRPREDASEPPPLQIVQEITEEEFLGRSGTPDDVQAPPPAQEAALQPTHTTAV